MGGYGTSNFHDSNRWNDNDIFVRRIWIRVFNDISYWTRVHVCHFCSCYMPNAKGNFLETANWCCIDVCEIDDINTVHWTVQAAFTSQCCFVNGFCNIRHDDKEEDACVYNVHVDNRSDSMQITQLVASSDVVLWFLFQSISHSSFILFFAGLLKCLILRYSMRYEKFRQFIHPSIKANLIDSTFKKRQSSCIILTL